MIFDKQNRYKGYSVGADPQGCGHSPVGTALWVIDSNYFRRTSFLSAQVNPPSAKYPQRCRSRHLIEPHQQLQPLDPNVGVKHSVGPIRIQEMTALRMLHPGMARNHFLRKKRSRAVGVGEASGGRSSISLDRRSTRCFAPTYKDEIVGVNDT